MSTLTSIPTNATIALDAPRSIVIKHKDKKFTYRFRRIAPADWKKYYAGIVHQTEVVRDEQVRTIDALTPLQALVESTLESVEGYTGKGGVSVDTMAEWKLKLPIGHKSAVGLVLINVDVEEPQEDVSVICDLTEVSISAVWSADENGIMARIGGLLHRFRHPTIEQLRRFNRESSRARVIGGSRTGRTIWPGRQEMLAQFYDELIVSVDGYTYGGEPLNEQPETIKNQMDHYHKVIAAQALFVSGGDAQVASSEQVEVSAE